MESKDKNNVELTDVNVLFPLNKEGKYIYNNDTYTIAELLVELNNNIGQRDKMIELVTNQKVYLKKDIEVLEQENEILKLENDSLKQEVDRLKLERDIAKNK